MLSVIFNQSQLSQYIAKGNIEVKKGTYAAVLEVLKNSNSISINSHFALECLSQKFVVGKQRLSL